MWLSVHIFHKNHLYSYESDRIILEVVKPFVEMCEKEKLIKKYFFIRYSENGPHIRLRLEVETPERLIELKMLIIEYIPEKFPQELHIEENNAWNNNSIFQFIDYEPEVERYGGIEGVKIAEEYFYCSSKLAISLVEKINLGDNSERLAKAIIADVILLKIFFDNISQSIQFLENYTTGYLYNLAGEEKDIWIQAFDNGFEKQADKISEFISQFGLAIDEGLNIDKDIDEFIYSSKKIKQDLQNNFEIKTLTKKDSPFISWQEVVFTIFPSYLHMMNNRLGMSVREESYIARLINNTFKINKTVEVF